MLNNTGGTETIRIENATDNDLPWIMELERHAFSQPWSFESVLNEVHNSDTFFAVAKGCGCEGLGFVVLRSFIDVGELMQIAVSPHFSGRGIGSLLLNSAIEHAKDCGLESVFLEVRESNVAAISLYEKSGFLPTRRRKDYYANPVEDAIEMSIKLSALKA